MIGREAFMNFSRDLAKKAQKRESETIQPKENLDGIKAMLTIKNYLGGNYYFTSDEVMIEGKNLFLIEGKHTENDKLPALEDIKDGLLKMVLFCNLEDVKIERSYNPIPTLKLTTGRGFDIKTLNDSQKELLKQLKKEAEINGFRIIINDKFFV